MKDFEERPSADEMMKDPFLKDCPKEEKNVSSFYQIK